MLKTRVIRIFLMDLLLIQNIHPRRLYVLYFIKRFLPMKPTQFINSPIKLIKFALFSMWTCHNGLMVPKSFIFNKVPNWFPWSFQFGFNASQFQWMISNRSYNFWLNIFSNIFQFVLLPTMKGHNLLWVNLWLLQSFQVIYVAYFNTFLQNLLHFFLHIPCQHYWHSINDYKKFTNYFCVLFLFFKQQQ
jgi:hypothetical protein